MIHLTAAIAPATASGKALAYLDPVLMEREGLCAGELVKVSYHTGAERADMLLRLGREDPDLRETGRVGVDRFCWLPEMGLGECSVSLERATDVQELMEVRMDTYSPLGGGSQQGLVDSEGTTGNSSLGNGPSQEMRRVRLDPGDPRRDRLEDLLHTFRVPVQAGRWFDFALRGDTCVIAQVTDLMPPGGGVVGAQTRIVLDDEPGLRSAYRKAALRRAIENYQSVEEELMRAREKMDTRIETLEKGQGAIDPAVLAKRMADAHARLGQLEEQLQMDRETASNSNAEFTEGMKKTANELKKLRKHKKRWEAIESKFSTEYAELWRALLDIIEDDAKMEKS